MRPLWRASIGSPRSTSSMTSISAPSEATTYKVTVSGGSKRACHEVGIGRSGWEPPRGRPPPEGALQVRLRKLPGPDLFDLGGHELFQIARDRGVPSHVVLAR